MREYLEQVVRTISINNGTRAGFGIFQQDAFGSFGSHRKRIVHENADCPLATVRTLTGRTGNKRLRKCQDQADNRKHTTEENEKIPQLLPRPGFFFNLFEKPDIAEYDPAIPPEVEQVYDNGNANSSKSKEKRWKYKLHGSENTLLAGIH
jgi:hypothetical protein